MLSFPSLPTLSFIEVLILLCSLLTTALNLIVLFNSKKVADALLSICINEVKKNIKLHLLNYQTISRDELVWLAFSIQEMIQSPGITHFVVNEVCRRVILDYEERKLETSKLRASYLIDNIVKDIEKNSSGVGPLSVAYHDRSFAYFLAVFGFSMLTLSAQVYLAYSPQYNAFRQSMFWLLLFVQGWFFFIGVRAFLFWKSRYHEIVSTQWEFPKLLSAKRPHKTIDWFLYRVISNDYDVANTGFAPIWETVTFLALPWSFILPILPLVTPQVKIIIMVVTVIFSSVWMASSHGYKQGEVRKMKSRFRSLQKKLIRAEIFKQTLNPNTKKEFVVVAQNLWVITGQPEFKEQAETVANGNLITGVKNGHDRTDLQS